MGSELEMLDRWKDTEETFDEVIMTILAADIGFEASKSRQV